VRISLKIQNSETQMTHKQTVDEPKAVRWF
jgi:hypothetical protein